MYCTSLSAPSSCLASSHFQTRANPLLLPFFWRSVYEAFRSSFVCQRERERERRGEEISVLVWKNGKGNGKHRRTHTHTHIDVCVDNKYRKHRSIKYMSCTCRQTLKNKVLFCGDFFDTFFRILMLQTLSVCLWRSEMQSINPLACVCVYGSGFADAAETGGGVILT